ncbi:MAG: hypothetical protein ACLR9Z_04255 [Alitiscatomonas sp.]
MKKMENISLPEAFVEKMSRLLGDGAGSFESYERERSFGLRVNPLKAGERLPEFLSGLERIPEPGGVLLSGGSGRESTRSMRQGLLYPGAQRPGVRRGPGSQAGRTDPGPLCGSRRKEYPSGREDGTEGASGVQ